LNSGAGLKIYFIGARKRFNRRMKMKITTNKINTKRSQRPGEKLGFGGEEAGEEVSVA
jgi:hypothetical protein